ncbi:ABC transporter permease [Arachnia propionica]|uniref:Autoinducer 2 import system permease protein LsrD n=1 Tax=Arachnia propionica TaxID=1750 RepID=A0A3P1TCE3_9ACTN|nr:ABC transporter permease [Arachnia propionica]RRD06576.1 ABC transporter permease [Arachnia propionica]
MTAGTIPTHARPLWCRVLLTREMAMVALLAVVLVVAAVTVPKFATPATVTYLLLDVAVILLIALPMTPIMITGDIDLSVGSMVGLGSVVFGVAHQAGAGVLSALLLALGVGVLGGLLNGLLVTRVGLPALAVTIGTMALFRGIAVGLLGTTAVTQFPREWTALAKARIPGTPIPLIMIVFLVLLVFFVVLLHATTFGRGVYAIGLSREAARFNGVAVARTRLVLFVLSGVLSAFAGVYFTLRFGSARGDNATGYELQVIAAVVLGGVSVFGGRGMLHGVVAGVLVVGALANALRLAGVTADFINIITGCLLVLSVMAASWLDWARRRRSRRNSSESNKGKVQ